MSSNILVIFLPKEADSTHTWGCNPASRGDWKLIERFMQGRVWQQATLTLASSPPWSDNHLALRHLPYTSSTPTASLTDRNATATAGTSYLCSIDSKFYSASLFKAGTRHGSTEPPNGVPLIPIRIHLNPPPLLFHHLSSLHSISRPLRGSQDFCEVVILPFTICVERRCLSR